MYDVSAYFSGEIHLEGGELMLNLTDPMYNPSSGSASLTLTDRGPYAVDDKGYKAAEGATTGFEGSLSVLTNDVIGNAPPLKTVTVVRNPRNGSVAINLQGEFFYTHASGYPLYDSFTYRITDQLDRWSEATVFIDVIPLPPGP
jgi:hypothetical protein